MYNSFARFGRHFYCGRQNIFVFVKSTIETTDRSDKRYGNEIFNIFESSVFNEKKKKLFETECVVEEYKSKKKNANEKPVYRRYRVKT